MDDYSEIAFECILQPSVLDTKVFGVSTKSDSEDRKTSVGILLELLTQLCSVTKTQIAVNIEGIFFEYRISANSFHGNYSFWICKM